MSKKKESTTKNGISRRQLVQTAGMAALTAAAGSMITSQAAAKAPAGERPQIYELLTLWLAISTNHHFAALDVDTITNDTGAAKAKVNQAINFANLNSNKSKLKEVRKLFDNLSLTVYNYSAGDCPKYLTTLGPIKKLGD